MKRIALSLALSSVLFGVQPVVAAEWGYPSHGNYPPQPDHPVLKKVLVGAGLIGLGVLIGRATAPQPHHGYYPQPIGPQYYPQQYHPGIPGMLPPRPGCVRF